MSRRWDSFKKLISEIYKSVFAVYVEITSAPVLKASREFAKKIFIRHEELSIRWERRYRIYLYHQEVKKKIMSPSVSNLIMYEWHLRRWTRLKHFQAWWLYCIDRPAFFLKNMYGFREINTYKLLNQYKINKYGVSNYTHKIKRCCRNLYWGFISFWGAIKIWIFSLFFGGGALYTLIIKRAGVLPQTLFFWVGLLMLLYWLVSGFVFFVKKYRYSRYTSVIQRFWRRSYILFWGIESCLLLVFFYLTVNASQESIHMFDQGHFIKTHLFSWRIFLCKAVLAVALIVYSYITLVQLKWNNFNKLFINLFVLTLILMYLCWMELYQIYWVSNFYANFTWLYDLDEAVWSLEWDARRTRILNHYIMILFLLKFWHIIFIFGCWLFFLLRSNELNTITYSLYSFNHQNFIIMFIMTWLFMYPWVKFLVNCFGETPYFWFYVDTHEALLKLILNDMFSFYRALFSRPIRFFYLTRFHYTEFIDWELFNINGTSYTYIKHTIRDTVLKALI